MKPRRFRSELSFSDSGVEAGTSLSLRNRLTTGPLPRHRYLSKLPNSDCTSRNRAALLTAERTLARLRTMRASESRRASSRAPYPATLAGSKPSKAARYPPRLSSIVLHERPACAPSSTRNSNSRRSSCSGTPHSSSW